MSPSAPAFTRVSLSGPTARELNGWLEYSRASYQIGENFGSGWVMQVNNRPTSVQTVAITDLHGGRTIMVFQYIQAESGQPAQVAFFAVVLTGGMWMWFLEGLPLAAVNDPERQISQATGRLLVRIDEALDEADATTWFGRVR